MNVYLIGFMGSGKTTVGKKLALRTGWACVDMDQEISKREGRSITEIFETNGESYFRDLESSLLKELSAAGKLLVTTGGGVVLRTENRLLMRSTGFVISLKANREVIKKRVEAQGGRPLLQESELDKRITTLLSERKGMYDDADLQIDTSNRDVCDIVEEILRHPSFPAR
jgi:shikimate kinase